MSELKWIKISTDIFDDEKILIIEKLPNADSIIVIWFKLLTLAGKQNTSGVFMMNDRIAYTDDMLAAVFRRDIVLVRLALSIFEQYGMIEIVEGAVTIPNWSKHQSVDKIEKRNDYHKQYMREYRAKQKLIACGVNCDVNSELNVKHLEVDKEVDKEVDIERDTTKSNVTCNVTVTKGNATEEEREEDIEKDIDKDIEKDKDTRRRIDYKLIIAEWNSLGISQITKISTSSTRNKLLKARINEYSQEDVIKAIHNIKESDFLKGKNDRGWVITFDWFIKSSNFAKVFEGNYSNKKGGGIVGSNISSNSANKQSNEQYEDDVTRALRETGRTIDLTEEQYDF